MSDQTAPSPSAFRNHATTWIVGALYATLLAWLVAPLFHNRILQREWEPRLDCYVQPAGFEMRYRTEGWATTRFGKYGISDIDDATALCGAKVAIWGDSFVEALQVADRNKVAQQLTATWSRRHPATELHGIGIGMGGRCVADHYFLMPAYEALLHPICHAVVIPTLDDISPDGVAFKSVPEFHFVRRVPRSETEIKIRRALKPFRTELVFMPAKDFANDLRSDPIRFSPGIATSGERSLASDEIGPTDCIDRPTRAAWRFALQSLKRQTSLPIVLVYLPKTPRLSGGKVVELPAKCAAVDTLATICRDEEVGFICAGERFERAFRETNRFCRGFPNTEPSRGHLNELGHRVLAELLCNYLEDRWDDLHAN